MRRPYSVDYLLNLYYIFRVFFGFRVLGCFAWTDSNYSTGK